MPVYCRTMTVCYAPRLRRAWRSQVCLPLYGRHLGNTNSAWEASDYADRTQPDAFWLRFYKEGTSRRREQWTV